MTMIRWGMIGCGSVTERKSGPAYQQVEGFALHGVFNRTLAKAEHYAARHGVPHAFASAEALIHSPEIDAVYIATPPDSHEAYALAVARAGKPCCIEKPMAPDHAACVFVQPATDSALMNGSAWTPSLSRGQPLREDRLFAGGRTSRLRDHLPRRAEMTGC